MDKALHSRDDVDRLYVSRKEGERWGDEKGDMRDNSDVARELKKLRIIIIIIIIT